MALRKKPKVEDAIIGTFVVFAFLYPFIITILIQIQEIRTERDERQILRMTYLFISGLEGCSTERAVKIGRFVERRFLHEIGGVSGLVDLCLKNRESLGESVTFRESFRSFGDTVLLEVYITDGRKLKVILYGRGKGRNFRITGFEYAEGS